MKVKLTDAQLEQLQPVFDDMYLAAINKEPGMVLGQIYPTHQFEQGFMMITFLEQSTANKIIGNIKND